MTANTVTTTLNDLLADGIVFYQKLRHYHWEVQGEQFFTLHEKFEEIYDKFNEANDELAERVITLGDRPLATLKQALEHTSLREDEDAPDANTMVANLVSDMEAIAGNLTNGIQTAGDAGDVGTEDMLTGMLQVVQKDTWMLRAYLTRALRATADSVQQEVAVS